MVVKIGSARIDENGNAHGGKAGDQNGREVSTQNWYLHSKGWRVYRAKNPGIAEKIALCMERACKNPKIGYDQYQRNTLYKESESFGFDVSKVTTACETDCSALVRVCCAYAGIAGLPSSFRTVNMPNNLKKTGAFTELTGSKYQSQSTYLGRGDILVTKTSGHTVVVLTNGPKYEGTIQVNSGTIQVNEGSGANEGSGVNIAGVEYALGDRIIRYGCEGNDVKLMQEMLLKLGYDLGSWGVDGDFGDCTDLVLRAFQKDAKVEVDGECGPITLAALEKAVTARDNPDCSEDACPIFVSIVNGNCYIRSAPNTDGKILGVAHKGEQVAYGGAVSSGGWLLVEHKGQNGWVSGKYGQLE